MIGAGRRGCHPLIFAVFFRSGAADHDLVLLDRDLDRAVARPVLGIDRIVLDRGIEPQAVALFAVIERALERTGRCGATARTPAAAPRGALGLVLVLIFLGRGGGLGGSGRGRLLLGLLAGRFLGGALLLLRLARGLFLELRGDQRIVLGAQVDLINNAAIVVGVRLEPLLALERLDLLDGHFQLVRDP